MERGGVGKQKPNTQKAMRSNLNSQHLKRPSQGLRRAHTHMQVSSRSTDWFSFLGIWSKILRSICGERFCFFIRGTSELTLSPVSFSRGLIIVYTRFWSVSSHHVMIWISIVSCKNIIAFGCWILVCLYSIVRCLSVCLSVLCRREWRLVEKENDLRAKWYSVSIQLISSSAV